MSLGTGEVRAFLESLAVEENVAASTQNQAFSALLYAYRDVFEIELGNLSETARAKGDKRLPVVLTVEEVDRVPERLDGLQGLVARLLYGSGLRLLEGLRLRVKDVSTTMIYTHVLNRPGVSGRSPLDRYPRKPR